MIEQHSIETTRLSRGAALVGSGARVGVNYLKFYARRALSGKTDERTLHEENADEVYRTFSRLKGGPLKLAQMLSIDRNLLPPAYASRFAQAQYSAPPLSCPLVVRTFRREFGCEPGAMFDSFTRQAAHGASIGQVHLAAKNGQEFAVKVQYPGVADSLRSDLRVIKPIALQVLGLREKDVEDYFHEIEARLLEETNYALELQRSIELSRSSAHLENVRFPVYYAALSSDRILTMDWVEGLPLDRFADGDATGQERDQIGQALWDFYAHQIHCKQGCAHHCAAGERKHRLAKSICQKTKVYRPLSHSWQGAALVWKITRGKSKVPHLEASKPGLTSITTTFTSSTKSGDISPSR